MGPHGCQQLQRPGHIPIPIGQGIGNRFTHGLEASEVHNSFDLAGCLDFAASCFNTGPESPIQIIG